jgi:hypothetical protein
MMASGIQLKPKNLANWTFHVTSRGVGNLQPFRRNIDKHEFLDRLSWYLGADKRTDRARRPYDKLFDEVAVLAICILDNHFHLILHQFAADGMERLMRRVLTGYGKYHNKHHDWKGPVFDARYAADPMRGPDHLREMLGYTILNNPIEQLGYEFSSSAVMLGERSSSWLRTDLALGVFDGVEGYRSYMNRTGPMRVRSKLERWGVDPALHPYRPI